MCVAQQATFPPRPFAPVTACTAAGALSTLAFVLHAALDRRVPGSDAGTGREACVTGTPVSSVRVGNGVIEDAEAGRRRVADLYSKLSELDPAHRAYYAHRAAQVSATA